MENQTPTVNYANSADGRALGFFQLSISTSLAIEAACGINPNLPKPAQPPIRHYKELWVNVRTLYRNIMGAIPKDIAASISSIEVSQIMFEEMQVIPDMLREYCGQPVKVVYYFNTMKNLDSKYPEAEMRKDSTPKQQQFTQGLRDVMQLMQHHYPNTILVFDDKLPGNHVDTLIITHVVYDLLWYKNFGGLTLLESHTGQSKPRQLWYTKFYQGKALAMIPFTEEMLQVFGDQETFHPLSSQLRKAIVELAEKKGWSQVTTRARIVDNINDLKNQAHVLKMKQLYKVLF